MWVWSCKLVGKCVSKLVSEKFMKHHNKNRPSPFPGRCCKSQVNLALVTFCASRRPREMYCGHARLCVCPRPHAHTIAPPFPQIDITGAVVIAWRVRGKIIRSVLCNIVCNNCAQCNAHTYEQT